MRIVIEGAGEVGSHLAKMLRAEANEVTIIDNDAARLEAISNDVDVETVCGNPSSLSVLRRANVDKADLYIAVYPFATQEVNIVGALLAKRLGANKVVARINDESYLNSENKLIFKELGIELLFYPEKSAADEIVSYLKHNSTAETMDFARGKLQLAVFKLDEDSPILDLKLSDFVAMLSPEELLQFRVVAITREDKTIIPKLDTKFHFGDLVFTITKREGVEALYRCFGKTEKAVSSVMIMGGSDIACMLATTLNRQGINVKIIESDKDRCIYLTETLSENILIAHADGRDPDVIYDEGISDYDAFVALTGKDETNVLACVVAKKLGVGRTIAEVENIDYIHLAEEMGVDTVINKKLITAGRIFRFTLSGKARFVRYMRGSEAEFIEYTVAPGAAITRGSLKSIDFPQKAIITSVIRGSEAIIAVGDTVIEAYDRVAIFALPECIKEIDKFFR